MSVCKTNVDTVTPESVNILIGQLPEGGAEKISDGYHTFAELYECRVVLNAAMLNSWSEQGLYNTYKSWKHSDGNPCFEGKRWFIVGAILPNGIQISFHYPEKDWGQFDVLEVERAPVWDGHQTCDVIRRLAALNSGRI